MAERTGIEWTDYVKREVVGQRSDGASSIYSMGENKMDSNILNITAPASDDAKQWDGWGTALKPAIEPIILARKPLDGTVANNVLAHGVGGLNIDACRVKGEPIEIHARTSNITGANSMSGTSTGSTGTGEFRTDGRFPANVLLDEHAAKEMDEQSGNLSPGNRPKVRNSDGDRSVYGEYKGQKCLAGGGLGSGGASRFFPVFKYQAKAPKKERPVIEREAIYGLRDDLTSEQVDHVRARLQEAGLEIE